MHRTYRMFLLHADDAAEVASGDGRLGDALLLGEPRLLLLAVPQELEELEGILQARLPQATHLLDSGNDRKQTITLDPRLPFPDSVGGIFPGPATTQKVYQGIEWFSQQAGLQSLTVLSINLIRGITTNINR